MTHPVLKELMNPLQHVTAATQDVPWESKPADTLIAVTNQRRRRNRRMKPPVSDVEVEVASVSEAGGRGQGLSRADCLCTVCLDIFVEPVTLPCDHTFCKECFLETVDKATLCCPLCRRRVSTWARLNGRNNTLVNLQLWGQIQDAFPLQCQRRLSGQDGGGEEDEDVFESRPSVSQPGEVRREYEDQISKLAEEKRALEEAESRASEEYIQRLLAEEEERREEERRRREEKHLEDDEKLARLLSNELNARPVSQTNVAPAKRKQKAGGHIEKFLCPRPSNPSDSSPTSSFMANKENILHSQPSSMVERPMPTMDYYYRQTDGSRSPPESAAVHPPSAPTDELDHPAGPSSTKRKTSELETTEEEAVAKRGCSSRPSASSSSVGEDGSAAGQVQLLQEITEWEAELSRRRRQEEEDRRLALLLQKELSQEDKQQATDRSKGSTNAYMFRQKCQAKETSTGLEQNEPTRLRPSSSLANKKTSSPSSSSIKKTRKTSSPSSSSSSVKKTPKTSGPSTPSPSSTSTNPLCRGSKQVTLMEMFPGLGS
ncbi:E3 ubiquitin-protein ligase rnf168-like [Diretmus argenteus]